MGFFSYGPKNEFEPAVVNEPSVFEPLKFYCSVHFIQMTLHNHSVWGGWVMRCVLLKWIIVGQGPIVLAVSVGGGCLVIFSLVYYISSFSLSLADSPI